MFDLKFTFLALASLWLLIASPSLAENSLKTLESNEAELSVSVDPKFEKSFNAYAILSLISEDDVVVVVTTHELRHSISEIYSGLPHSLEEGVECNGQVMLTIDGEQGATFLLQGMFPPERDPTHSTVYCVVNRGNTEFTFMIHYPIEYEDSGFDEAYQILNSVRWAKKKEKG